MSKNGGKPDRIDFSVRFDGTIQIMELRRDMANPGRPRDIPIPDRTRVKPAGFDLEAALNWCRSNGYIVRQITGSARAWLGGAWVIRTRSQIKRRRERAERANEDYFVDFAYDG